MNGKKILMGSLVAGGALALLRLAFARVPSAKQASKLSSYAAIDAYLAQQMQRLSIPGAALAIVEGKKIVHLCGLGTAWPGGEAPTPQTPFMIGSLTKSITALAVMQQVEAGRIELDAPVTHYLPWFRVMPPQDPQADRSPGAGITVRHLLNQTSGLPMLAGMVGLGNFDTRPDAAERQARALASLTLSHPAGAVCEYSNLNYNLLGLILEAVSGEKYADYVQNHIFDPLEMRHSYTSREAAKANGLAVGHRYWFSLPVAAPELPIPQASIASGQLFSCSEDMAHFLIAQLNGGRFGKSQILSEAGIQELQRGEVEYIAMGISSGRYAMGWFDMQEGQTRVLSHGGNVPDYSAYMCLLPEQKKGALLLINADHYGLPPVMAEIGAGIAALLAGQQPGPMRLGFLPWLMRALPLIPILQIAGAAATLRRLDRWRGNPALRPGCGRLWTQHVLLPLVPNLSFAALLAFLSSRGILGYLRFYNPDLAWILRMGGGFAGFWAVLRSVLTLRAAKRDAENCCLPCETGRREAGRIHGYGSQR